MVLEDGVMEIEPEEVENPNAVLEPEVVEVSSVELTYGDRVGEL